MYISIQGSLNYFMFSPKFAAFAKGDPNRLLYPTDSMGQRCGTAEFTLVFHLFKLKRCSYLLINTYLECIILITLFND